MAPIFEFESPDSSSNGTATMTVGSSPPAKSAPQSYAALLRPTPQASPVPSISRPTTPLQPAAAKPGSALSTPTTVDGIVHTRVAPRPVTAQGGLAKLLANSTPASRAPSEAGDLTAERAAENKGITTAAKKKRTKKNKKGASRGAGVSTAGLERPSFLEPNLPKSKVKPDGPVAAGCLPNYGEPDWTFIKRPTPCATPSEGSRASTSPPRSGLSSLLSQAHPGDLVSVRSSPISASSDAGDVEPTVAYEVAIDEDYVDKEVDSRPVTRTGSPLGAPRKKMTADDFEPLKCLGKGTFGTVILVRHKATGRLYAQKQLKKATLVVHKKIIEQTKTERAILETMRHPNVVKLYYAFQDQEKLYLILEYAQGGELFHHLEETKMFSEDTAAFYIAQLVLALSHLHLNVGVVYRDLKPENCLLDAEGHLLLTDFGLSKVRTDDSRCRSLLGTPEYMAPEVLSGEGEKEYGPEVDWWAVGILACEFLTGGTPFLGNSPEKVKQKIKTGKVNLPFYLSADAKDIITRLLRKEPQKRLGYNLPKDLQTIKKHRFFRKVDWAALERRDCEPPIKPLVTDPELAENFSDDFTELPLSPTFGGFMGSEQMLSERFRQEKEPWEADNPFGGFSFVASSSLLNRGFLAGDW